MIFSIVCVTCHLPIENEPVSIRKVTKWGTITNATHKECYENNKEKWIKNDWEVEL